MKKQLIIVFGVGGVKSKTHTKNGPFYAFESLKLKKIVF